MSTISSSSSSTSSNSTSSAYNTSSRITGMFSNLDTDALVKSMTSTQQSRINAVKNRQTRQEWYTSSLTSVKDDVNEFLNTYISSTGSSSMLKSATYATYKAVTSSTANAVSITASSSTDVDDISIQINTLATNASATSSGKISRYGTEISSNNTATLESLSLAKALEFNTNGKISFDINGKTFNFAKDTTLQSMINTINTDPTANVTMKYSRLSDAFTITSDSGGAQSKVKITNLQGNAFGTNSAFGIGDVSASITGSSVSSKNISANGTVISADNTATLADLSFAKKLTFDSSDEISFSINSKTFTFAKTTTLQDMLDTVNNDTTANAVMTYNRSTDGFTLMSTTGSVSLKNISGNAFGTNSAFGIAEATIKSGTDSEAVINGTTVTRNSNEYSIDGIGFDLKKVTKGTSEQTVSFSIERDYSSTVSAVSKMVDAYNTLLNKLKSLNSETDNSADYPPLTDDQKADMTTEQITTWETKAKSGLLRHNSDLESLISSLKSTFYSSLGGISKSAADIGITAAGYFDSSAGEIALNESALTEALQSNAEEVIGMFTNGSSTAASSEQGLMYKLKSSITTFTSTIKDQMETATEKISKYDTEISDLEDKLADLADRYYSKFSAMETALSKLNSQSSFIGQMFSSGS